MTSHAILLIPRIRIHNANALSSPYTIGFPAMTSWLGAVHALQRKLRQEPRLDDEFEDLRFPRMGVVCHNFTLHTYKDASAFEYSIIGTSNPLDKHGKRPSFIEEARCDLTVSLLIEYDTDDDGELVEAVRQLLPAMKMAGGDILDFKTITLHEINSQSSFHKFTGTVMPGYCLIERRELMQEAMLNGQDALDTLLDYLKLTYRCEQDDNGKVTWTTQRKQKGWLVPIATGFHGISEPQAASHQRDADSLHLFAESIVTLGEFIMPYRLENIEHMLWHYHFDTDNNLYLCQQTEPETV